MHWQEACAAHVKSGFPPIAHRHNKYPKGIIVLYGKPDDSKFEDDGTLFTREATPQEVLGFNDWLPGSFCGDNCP